MNDGSLCGFVFDDGGRARAGYKGQAGDCVCRSIAIASGLPYQEIYNDLNAMGKHERIGKNKRTRSNSETGVFKSSYNKYLLELGFEWVACTGIGTGCKVHLKANELPDGILITRLSGHLACVINGVIHDIFDCSRGGTRCVYGYYRKVS